ncbi:MAG TPA: UDP-N-acetylglucosamine--N-acetylmuramyl-(pentapeptide) pyrophosphoryl-undecaprenol N-acetylglucosamine transferase [Candidatus Andersenbacteria bacterium]|nr:MAG: hypothetical protein A2854_01740 [Parcubacteria group bacterium RIFCSPHIGHO2_01_FULL_56_18]HLD25697.1 UDP-N-acetylglucosamine--N-acetylmuramyl-(pentapeptide) pyrophosphoryl-undecaprenol N-acetylglucosamine transferase [Candidatus Andersenbacteria bacterium]
MRIVLTGGATGGHVIPFEPIVDALRVVYAEQKESLPGWIDASRLDIYFLGVLTEPAARYFEQLGVKAIHIPSGKLRRYPSAQTVGDLLGRLPLGVLKALLQMWRIMPDAVISKGGFGSLPTSVAAVFYRIPFLLHESDAVLGLANRVMASWASVITVGYADTRRTIQYYKNKTLVTGTPVRALPARPDPAAIKREYGLPDSKPMLLVIGGSQGAKQINDVVLQVLPSLVHDMAVIHVTGSEHEAAVKQRATEVLKSAPAVQNYKVFGYLPRILPVMAAADVVLSRAGATSLAELAHVRKASIVVPLSGAAQDHQRHNAAVLEAAGAARVLDPDNLGRSLLEQSIRDILNHPEIRATLETNIALLDKPRAARDIAELAFKLARGFAPRQGAAKE